MAVAVRIGPDALQAPQAEVVEALGSYPSVTRFESSVEYEQEDPGLTPGTPQGV